jgi:hypothetical protein
MDLGRLPYTLGFKMLQLSLTSLPLELWSRNSFRTPAFTPFKSDLDLTFWLENSPNFSEVKSMWRTHRFLKKFIPFLGEINLHVRDEALSFVELANQFELNRDPDLHSKLKVPPRKSSRADEIIFLLRMLEADAKNIKTRPDKRIRKWRFHLAQIGAPRWTEPLTLESMLTAILQRSGLPGDEQTAAVKALLTYYEIRAKGETYYGLPADQAQDLMTFLPHYFCFHKEKIEALSGERAEICLRQVRWETWGLSSQYRLFSFAGQSLDQHLQNLIYFVPKALGNHPESNEMSEALRKLFLMNQKFLKRDC